ncbi:glycosyltransferase [Pseudochryseolinea flava]|uniref:Group 1 glycosyl transferase n=1 Tax=Pseudochryseolinea flava TaxID=2059302 RepID=A0A364Y369_9BACT|nr:glycosyltransferase [Pseudochryseolinea flava]RAW01353.1 group 1 glycosyl transferase [Pseudochryseolinea flava]
MAKNDSMDIIMLALPRWDGDYSSTAYSLAKEFSRDHRVFYVDNPFTLKDFFSNYKSRQIQSRKRALLTGSGIYTKINDNLVAVTPKLTIPVNFLPEGALYDKLSAINDRILFHSLKRLIRDYKIKDFIFINSFNPFYGRHWPKYFKPSLYIYHTVDDISHSKYIHKHGPRLETEEIRRADLTFTTSIELKRLKASLTKNIYYLPNAADVSMFKDSLNGKYKMPEEIAHVIKPIVAYTGHLDDRLDYDLLKYVFKANPDKAFLMIGPSSISKSLYDELAAFENVIFTGKKDISELPKYLHFVKSTIIPFKCNTLTRSIYPLKVNEYLAAGKPVVSTPFSEDIMSFSGTIEIASNYEDFSNAITKTINTDSPELIIARQCAAEKNTWEARAASFWEVIDDYLK